MDFASTVFLTGMGGGAANEILHWWGLRKSSKFPKYATRVFYWVITVMMIILGGFIAALQLGKGGEPFIAFQIGILAPMLLKKIGSSVPETTGAMGGDDKLDLRGFFKG